MRFLDPHAALWLLSLPVLWGFCFLHRRLRERSRRLSGFGPGVERVSVDLLMPVAEDCVKLGIPVIALFPVIDPSLKTPDGREAANPQGLIPRAVRELKARFPELGVLTDVALDPYTSHGQDGMLDDAGYVMNDETIEILVEQGVVEQGQVLSSVA